MASVCQSQYYEKKELTVIANNSTDINKANNYLSPHITEYKKTTIYNVGNPGSVWGETFTHGGVSIIRFLIIDRYNRLARSTIPDNRKCVENPFLFSPVP